MKFLDLTSLNNNFINLLAIRYYYGSFDNNCFKNMRLKEFKNNIEQVYV